MKVFIYAFLVMSFFSCTDDVKSPEGLIQKFVLDMTKGNVDREYFERYATGDFKDRALALTDEEFESFTVMNVKNPKVDILSKSCEEGETQCSLTYVVRYDVYSEDKKTFQSEIKKIAQVRKEDKYWKLLSVSNIKTFYNSTEAIDTLEE